MPYRIECTGSLSTNDATEADIGRIIDDDGGRGDYAILFAPDGSFLQIGEGTGPFTLEHRDASTDEHIQTITKLSKTQVKEAFLKYLRNDANWRTAHSSQPLQLQSRGCLSILILAAAIAFGSAASLRAAGQFDQRHPSTQPAVGGLDCCAEGRSLPE